MVCLSVFVKPVIHGAQAAVLTSEQMLHEALACTIMLLEPHGSSVQDMCLKQPCRLACECV